MTTITICSSSKFFDKLPSLRSELETAGFTVMLPDLTDYHGLDENALAKIVRDLIRTHFAKIEQSNAVYIANFDKDSVKGYIGANTLLEMGKAFDMRIPIFLLNDLPSQSSYREELLALQPVKVGKDWVMLNKLLREWQDNTKNAEPENKGSK